MSDPAGFRPSLSALNQLQPLISETASEKTTFIWEIHDHTLPTCLIPEKQIINPKAEPDRDTSVSILDSTPIRSATFIRGQGISKPAEWQLHLQCIKPEDETKEEEVELVLTCNRIYPHGAAPIISPIWAKVAYEIIDEFGSPLKSNGDVLKVEPKLFRDRTNHVMPLGTKVELQSKRAEFLIDGIIRFRLRMNIYKELSAIKNTPATENDSRPPAKRMRLENPPEMSLTGLLGSLDNLWNGREQSGNVTIHFDGKSTKAHNFILTSRSSVFMSMLESQMETEEKETMTIRVTDISGETMNAFLEYLYLGDSMQFDWFNIDNICRLVYAADKYNVISLKNKCYEALLQMMNLENFWKVAKATFMYESEKEVKNQVRHFYECHQITLAGIESFRTFAHENFDEFYKLFFYRMLD